MLLGQSIFQSVLTRLDEEHADDSVDEARQSFRIQGLGSGFVAAPDDGPVVTAGGAEAYFAFLPEEPVAGGEPLRMAQDEPQPAPVAPPHLLRLSSQEIAEDLGITPSDTEAELSERRRQFAKANHPDGVSPEFRENANKRMQTANLLIDTAIRQLSWR
jgi:hypothetical protein